jgi:class 3 adenylate cyclase/tetratricopeptide (TPR) repeat protein
MSHATSGYRLRRKSHLSAEQPRMARTLRSKSSGAGRSTGPVTFAFTDIEGSTQRWDRNRTAMQEAVRRHDAILRAAITENGGQIFKTMGDAFLSVFPRPGNAVAAMLTAQQSLTAVDFSAIDGLRVRAAMHTGTAEEREGDYFGPTVNKVARLLAIGHGGQILVTSETAALAKGTLPDDVSLRDLGTYHLKDFAEPQRVHQLLAPGLPADFPPLRSLGTLPSDLSIVDAAEFHPVPSFRGRDEELAIVHAALKPDGAIAVVHGLGGVGKSSLAREYGWRRRDAYSVVWWLNAQTEDGVIDGLVSLGAMFVQGLDQLDDRRAAAKRVVNSVLGGFDKPVLLVFDNLEDEGLMRTWLPRTARALATSRDAAWSTDITAIPVQVWSLETAAGYLLSASGRTDLTRENAHVIAQTLGALPLALAHAAASLRNARMVSPEQYLERIAERLKSAPRRAEYPRSVFATFSTAIAQAEQQAPGAAAVLCFASSFAPDAIPDELFRQPLQNYAEHLRPVIPSGGEPLDLRDALADALLLDEALGALDRLWLLTFAENTRTYSMHRLVALAARDLIAAVALPWWECAVDVAESAFPKIDFSTWPQCERLAPHARVVLDALPNDLKRLSAARLAHRCGQYFQQRGAFTIAEALNERALAIREQALGPDHLDVAHSLNSLALAYESQGRYTEAEPLHIRSLTIRTHSLGPEHLGVATSLCNLGVVYHRLGRYAEAEAFHERALAIRETMLGPDHPDVAPSVNNLAIFYYDIGRYAEAERLHMRARAISEKALGPDHPAVAMSLDSLGVLYQSQGHYAEAESFHARALAIREKALGPDHPDVAETLNGLANVQRHQGRYAEAEALHERALAIRKKGLGSDHPAVAESLNDLALVYRDQGRHQETAALLSSALSIRERALGSDHPSTKATREALDALRCRA